MLLWPLTIWAIREDRVLLAIIPLVLAVATKWDAVVLPGLYLLAWATAESWKPVAAKTALMIAASLGVYAILRSALPGGFAEKDAIGILAANLRDLWSLNITHPPVLAFAIPAVLMILGFRHPDRFVKASAAFGLMLFLPLATGAVFREVRAEMIVLIAILPAALFGFAQLIEREQRSSK